jgi:YfiH family protein
MNQNDKALFYKDDEGPKAVKAQNLLGYQTIRHAFFTRLGGVSKGEFSSLNCSNSGGDDEKDVQTNINLVKKYMACDRIATLNQQHTSDLYVVDENWDFSKRQIGDALITQRPGIALGIFTADCAPVLFYDPKSQMIAAAHAGWRGAFSGIIEKTIGMMVSMGAQRENLIAAIGPSIGPISYEVDSNFYQEFIRKNKENSLFFNKVLGLNKYLFDLQGYIENKFFLENINKIERSIYDTYRDNNIFFSYRRSQLEKQSQCGRMLSVIVMDI